MAERIDIIVSAAQNATAIAQGGGQAFSGIPSRLPDPTPDARRGIEGLAQGVLGLQAAFAGLAVVQVGQQMFAFGVQAGQAALQLEKVENTAKLLSGTTDQYNKLVELARRNQILFGGTLAENVQGLGLFANQARKTGIEIAVFNDLSQRLNLLSPEQGLEGAAIALKEALAGDTLSLVSRFELPRAELAELRNASLSAQERIEILNRVLEEQGVAAGAAAGTVSSTAKAYNYLSQQTDALRTNFGRIVADAFAPAAAGLGLVIERSQVALQRIVGLQGGIEAMAASAGLIPGITIKVSTEFSEMGGGGGSWSDGAKANERLTAALDTSALAAQKQEQAMKAAQQAVFEAQNAGGGLEAQAIAGAKALLDNGRAGEAAAAQLAQSSSQIDIMTAAQYRLQASLLAVQAVQNRPGYGGSMPQDARVAQEASQASAFRLRVEEDILRATGSTAEKLAQVNRLIRTTADGSDERRALLVQQAVLEKQLREEGQRDAQRSASEAERLAKRAATERERLAEQERRERERRQEEIERALQRIEERTADHYQRLGRAQEDYVLRQSRNEEDYQIRRQRLLAEGRIKEAQLLGEEFQRSQRRAEEDRQRERQRQDSDLAQDIAQISENAQLNGSERRRPTAPAGLGTTTPAAPAGPGLGAPNAPAIGGMGVLRLEFAPLELLLNGEKLTAVIWPTIEMRMDEALATGVQLAGVVSPPIGGQGSGVGGPRP